MTRLSVFANYLNSYLKIHGDKEVLSVATAHGSDTHEFSVHMADIHEGPIGTNPYKGRDVLDIPKNVTMDEIEFDMSAEEESAYDAGYENGYDAGRMVGIKEQRDEYEQKEESDWKMMKYLWGAVFICSVINLVSKAVKKK